MIDKESLERTWKLWRYSRNAVLNYSIGCSSFSEMFYKKKSKGQYRTMCTPSPTSHCAPLRETLHCDARGTILSQIAWHRLAQNVTFVSPSNQALKYFDYLFMSKFLVVIRWTYSYSECASTRYNLMPRGWYKTPIKARVHLVLLRSRVVRWINTILSLSFFLYYLYYISLFHDYIRNNL